MKILKMLLRNIFKKKEYVFCILVGVYIAAVLWITLFSRIGSEYREFLYPFYSYRKILKGSREFLFENIENVILFVPFGIILECMGVKKTKRVIMIGFVASFSIEVLQAFFSLGTFECDDLMHNTIGTGFGYYLAKRVWCDFQINLDRKMKALSLFSIILCMIVPCEYQKVKDQKWVNAAALYDRDDGTKNLLILNGMDGVVWDTKVHVEFLSNGSIHIKGTADRQSWWPIGQIILEPGTYSFSGLSGVREKTLGLELEAYNQRFAPDVGVNEKVQFTLKKTTELKVYIIVYEGCNCDVIAVPVLYREE